MRISDWSSDVCSSDLTGIANNRDLRIAAANVQQARAQDRVQRADRLPTVNATGPATYTNHIASMGGGAGSPSYALQLYHPTVGLSALAIALNGGVPKLSSPARDQQRPRTPARRSPRS